MRPDRIGVTGVDLDGNEVEFEAEEFFGRVIQHELDHLDGVLLLERLDDDQRRSAKKAVRELQMALNEPTACLDPQLGPDRRRTFLRLR